MTLRTMGAMLIVALVCAHAYADQLTSTLDNCTITYCFEDCVLKRQVTGQTPNFCVDIPELVTSKCGTHHASSQGGSALSHTGKLGRRNHSVGLNPGRALRVQRGGNVRGHQRLRGRRAQACRYHARVIEADRGEVPDAARLHLSSLPKEFKKCHAPFVSSL